MAAFIKRILTLENILLLVILLAAAFMRLYRLRDYIVFLGDEGRDVIVVRNILRGNFTLLGPTASVGGFYLGPIYYYLMAPFLFLANYDPVGPAYLVVFLGIATVYLVYLFGKKFFSPSVGLSAAWLYALSPLIIRFSRASWNPNPLPFFSLLGVYLLTQGAAKNKKLFFYLAGVCLGVAWQLHYLSLILSAVYLALSLKPKRLLLLAAGWLTSFSPFLAFEIRHGFPNTRTVIEFITRPKGAINLTPKIVFSSFCLRITQMFSESFSLPKSIIVITLALIAIAALIYRSYRGNKNLLVWFTIGVFGMSLYQGAIHNYYFGFLFPVPFLMIGLLFSWLWQQRLFAKIIAVAGVTALSFNFLQRAIFWHPANKIITQTQEITQVVQDMASGKPYNFALISSGNSDHAYRYFLELSSNPPVPLEKEVTEQLIIVCEQPAEFCEPRGHPLWEVAAFGQLEIDQVRPSPRGYVTIIKTIHYLK